MNDKPSEQRRAVFYLIALECCGRQRPLRSLALESSATSHLST
jgi:hypothetical protein